MCLLLARRCPASSRPSADRLVARFLAEEEVNYQLYNYIATVSEEADSLEAQLAAVHTEIEAGGQDTHAMQLHEQVGVEVCLWRRRGRCVLNLFRCPWCLQTVELRSQLTDAEYQLHEQSTREKQLVSQLHGVAAQLVKMYKQLK
jgi:nitric oxide synthase oxygenase domain/subunit